MAFKEEMYNSFVCDFSNNLRQKIQGTEISKLVFLCIGTNRVIGDCFGPLVGSKLKHFFIHEEGIEVIGDIENIVSFQNVTGIIRKLKNENSFVIAIDAALSCNSNRIGKIIVNQNKMNVGNSMNKKQLYIGDISIKGIVGKDFKNSRNNFNALQNMPLNIIIDMAECVSTGIYNVINV